MYTKPGHEFIGSLNAKDCAELATNKEYIGTVSSIRYAWKIDDMRRPKAKAENDIGQ